MRPIPIETIDAARFAPFGALLEAPESGARQDHAARLDDTRADAALNLALVRSRPYPDAMPLRRLERHPHASQAFLPLSVAACCVVVAPDAGGRPDETAIRAFAVPGTTGIVYRRATWHAHMMTLAEPGVFAMLVHEDGSPEDCVFAPIAPVGLAEPPR